MVATIGIFLPAFVLVGVLNPFIPRLRSSQWLSSFLDAVNASAVALMAAVTVVLAGQILISVDAMVIAGLAALAALRFGLGPVWIILGSAMLGLGLAWLH